MAPPCPITEHWKVVKREGDGGAYYWRGNREGKCHDKFLLNSFFASFWFPAFRALFVILKNIKTFEEIAI